MKKSERNYLIYSVALFLVFLIFWTDLKYIVIQIRYADQLFELIFLILCFLSALVGFAITFEAKNNKPVFWKLLGASLMPCGYIYILMWGTANYWPN